MSAVDGSSRTYFNTVNASNIGRSAFYTLTAPVVAIVSLGAALVPIGCGCFCSKGASDTRANLNRTLTASEVREVSEQADDIGNVCCTQVAPSCIRVINQRYYEWMHPYEPLVETVRGRVRYSEVHEE